MVSTIKTYAIRTSVPVERTRAELDTLLHRHGATSRFIGQDDTENKALIGFVLNGARFRLNIPLPAEAVIKTNHKYEQELRARWRAVFLMVKSKLEIIRLGVSTPTREFMADLILDDGSTVEEVFASGYLWNKTLPPKGGST